MPDAASENTSGAGERARKTMPVGHRFERGKSGCPGGGRGLRKRALAEELARFAEHYAREPSSHELLLCEQLAQLRTAKPVGALELVRVSNTIARLSGRLYGKPKASAPAPAITTAELIERYKAKHG
jgi:hypothetical protein